MPPTAKKQAIEAIERLPDDVPMDEIVYRLYVISKVREGIRDVEAGRALSQEELSRDIESW